MARGNSATVEATEEVDAPEIDDELEDTSEASVEGDKPAKTPKEKKEPARGDLPEGYVTPVGLAAALSERKLHTNRAGETVDVAPQMVYSYIRNASKEAPFPIETVKDSLGKDRQAVKLDDGLAWWAAKNERAAARKANAATKAEKKAAKAAEAKVEEGTPEAEAVEEAVEAE